MSQPPEKPRIAICIPTKGTVSIEFAMNVLHKMPMEPWDWCSPEVFVGKNRYTVVVARNKLARAALEKGFDYIFWLDDDQLFLDGLSTSAAIKKLWELNVPIASGVTLSRGGGIPIARLADDKSRNYYWPTMWKNYTREELDNAPNVFEAAMVGMYCCLVKREVFEKLKYPYFHWDKECLSLDDNMEPPTEDEYFMWKAHELGYKVMVRKDVQLGHMVTTMLLPDGSIEPVMD
jgi:hypothetical protein